MLSRISEHLRLRALTSFSPFWTCVHIWESTLVLTIQHLPLGSDFCLDSASTFGNDCCLALRKQATKETVKSPSSHKLKTPTNYFHIFSTTHGYPALSIIALIEMAKWRLLLQPPHQTLLFNSWKNNYYYKPLPIKPRFTRFKPCSLTLEKITTITKPLPIEPCFTR